MVAGALLWSAPAAAGTTVLPIALSSMCVAASMFEAQRAAAEPSDSGISKAQAILGGAPSKLDLLRARDDAFARPSPETDGMTGLGFQPFCGDRNAAVIAAVELPRPAQFMLPPSFVQPLPFVEPQPFVPTIPTDRPDIFGSVALKITATPLSARWETARAAALGTRPGPWTSILRSVRHQDRQAQVATINSWVNARIRFMEDGSGRGRADHWTPAAQSLRNRRGDCEDYAIAKMQMLRALGVADEDLYFVIARDLVRRADHALLVVRLDGRLVTLDNQTDRLIEATQANGYRPIFTYAGTQAWMHGYRPDPVTAPMRTASLQMAAFGQN